MEPKVKAWISSMLATLFLAYAVKLGFSLMYLTDHQRIGCMEINVVYFYATECIFSIVQVVLCCSWLLIKNDKYLWGLLYAERAGLWGLLSIIACSVLSYITLDKTCATETRVYLITATLFNAIAGFCTASCFMSFVHYGVDFTPLVEHFKFYLYL